VRICADAVGGFGFNRMVLDSEKNNICMEMAVNADL
jgi:hypothetical protein